MKIKNSIVKKISIILSLALFMSSFVLTVQAVGTSGLSDYLYLNFEDNSDVALATSGTGTWYNDGVSGSNGSMFMKTDINYSAVAFPAYAEAGKTKTLSVCLKSLNGTFGSIQLIFYHNVIRSTGVPTTDMKAFEVITLDKELDLGDGWAKYSKVHLFSNTSRWQDVANGDTGNKDYVKAGGNCTVEVRVNATGVEYLEDELIIDPVWASQSVNKNYVLYGGFKTDTTSEGFLSEGYANLSYTSGAGASGTSGYLTVNNTINNSGVRKNTVNMIPGRTYKISWYAKVPAGSGALGKWVMAYLDFAGLSTEAKVVYGSQYQGIMAMDSTAGSALTEEWQYYECYYKVKNEFLTDFTKPNFYTRLVGAKDQTTGIGSPTTPYCIDEIKFEALENPYNGSFNLPFTNSIKTTKMGTFTPWEKGSNTQVTNETTGGAPEIGSYIKVVQGANATVESNQQISSFVDIKPSDGYKLAFWAKYDTLPSNVVENNAFLQIVVSKGVSGEYHYLNAPGIHLTNEWKYYTIPFSSSALSKTSQLVIRFLGGLNTETASYSIDEIKLQNNNESVEIGKPVLSGTVAVGNTLTASILRPSGVDTLIYRVLTSEDGVNYAGIKQGVITDNSVSYTITNNNIGKYIRIQFGGLAGTAFTNLTDATTADKVSGKVLEFTNNWGNEITAAALIFDENVASRQYVGILAQYNDKKELVKVDSFNDFVYEGTNKATLSMTTAVIGEAVIAKAFLWNSLTDINPVVASKSLFEEGYVRMNSFNAALEKQVTYREVSNLSDDTINVKAILYNGMPYNGQETEVFAYIGLPEGASAANPVPGVVLVHGGAGKAEKDWVKTWNDKGYAAISFYWREANTYSGLDPDVDYVGGPRKNGYFMDYTEKIENQWMYHAVSDAILAHNLLGSLPEVDSEKIGITGISWGGIITSYTIGIDSRLKFAVPVYGCGFLIEGAIDKGLSDQQSYWDAKNVLTKTTVPTLWLNSNIDAHFALDSTMLSYDATSSVKNIYIAKDLSHGQSQGANLNTIFSYADSLVKNGTPLAKTNEFNISGNHVSFAYTSQNDISAVRIVYNTTGIIYSGTTSQTDWVAVSLTPSDFGNGMVNYTFPDATKGFYFELTDNVGRITSTTYTEI